MDYDAKNQLQNMKGGREWVYIFDAPILTIRHSFLSVWLILMHNHVIGVQERRFGGWACLHIAMLCIYIYIYMNIYLLFVNEIIQLHLKNHRIK